MSQHFITNLLLHIGIASLQSFLQISILWALVFNIFKKKEQASSSATAFTALVFTQLVSITICIISFVKPVNIEINNPQYFANNPYTKLLFNYNFSTPIIFLGIAYCVLAVYKLFQFIANYKTVNTTKSFRQAENYYTQFVNTTAAHHFKLQRKVKVLFTDAVVIPCTIHILKPLILLPIVATTQLTSKQIELIIQHELAHIKRNDYAINLFLHFSYAIIWFNPYNNWLKNTIDQLREKACDELVLQQNEEPILYAETLLHLAKATINKNKFSLAITGNNQNNLFKKRIESILTYSANNQVKNALLLPIFVIAIMVFTIGFISIQFNTDKSFSKEKVVASNKINTYVTNKQQTLSKPIKSVLLRNKKVKPTVDNQLALQATFTPNDDDDDAITNNNYQFVANTNPEIISIKPAVFKETIHEVKPEKTFIQIKQPANELDSNSKQLNVIFELQKRVLKRAKI